MYRTVAQQEAVVDAKAYSYIESEVFWPGFKKYLKERHDYDYSPSLEAIDYHKYASDFQATIDRYVPFQGRVLFWKVPDMFLEPEVWEFEARDLAVGMSEWNALHRMSLVQLLRWHMKKKNT